VAHHALREQAGERFVQTDVPAPPHRAHEKSRIKQVKDRVLDPANVLIDGQPTVDRVLIYRDIGAR
jgi:hypothetical protein